jgi:phosphoenolpyruvate phosphomutase
MSPELAPSDTSGEWIGLMKTSPKGSTAIRESLTELAAREDFRALHLHDLFEHLIARGERIRVVYITGHWLDVDNLEDLALAQAF